MDLMQKGQIFMDTIKVTIEIYDNSTVQEVENAIEIGLNEKGIACTYEIEKVGDNNGKR